MRRWHKIVVFGHRNQISGDVHLAVWRENRRHREETPACVEERRNGTELPPPPPPPLPTPGLHLPLTPEVQGDDLILNKSARGAWSASAGQRGSIQRGGGSLGIRASEGCWFQSKAAKTTGSRRLTPLVPHAVRAP